MSSYEVPSLNAVDAVLDALDNPTSEEVWRATLPYSERAIAATAARRADIAGGGSGNSPVLMASLTLDDAGIRGLSDTPAVIIPATTLIDYDPEVVPSKVFRPIAATVIASIVTEYAVSGEEPMIVLGYSSDWANDASARTQLTLGAGTWQFDLPCPLAAKLDSRIQIVGIQGQPINGDWLDNALVLATADAVITGGDAANTLTVTVLYIEIDVPTVG